MISGCCWDAGCGTAFNLPLPFVMLSCGAKRDQIARRLPVEVSFGVGMDPAAFPGPSRSQRAAGWG